jgi:hypothetical protein
MTRHNNRAEMTVTEILEDTKSLICNDYCKYTDEFRDLYRDPDEAMERMVADKCNYCPLARL